MNNYVIMLLCIGSFWFGILCYIIIDKWINDKKPSKKIKASDLFDPNLFDDPIKKAKELQKALSELDNAINIRGERITTVRVTGTK